MKTIILISALLVSANAVAIEDIIDELEEVGKMCAEREGATEADMVDLEEENFPPSRHAAKCVIACFYEHYKIMRVDGTFNKQVINGVFSELKAENEELYRQVMKIINVCYDKPNIVSNDRCETASAVATCIKRGADAVGLNLESFMTD
ncbi:general odorant-binding protein 19d-like isoform X1 [Zophobas morio]|uniref:general odorant-binding protein 19d-like isoform X1 n=2 Tax=Zophobas morio TaxID=2755281 RepID=UPI003083261A